MSLLDEQHMEAWMFDRYGKGDPKPSGQGDMETNQLKMDMAEVDEVLFHIHGLSKNLLDFADELKKAVMARDHRRLDDLGAIDEGRWRDSMKIVQYFLERYYGDGK